MSKDAVAVATLLGSLLMVRVMAGPFLEQIRQFFQFCFASIRTGETGMIETLPLGHRTAGHLRDFLPD